MGEPRTNLMRPLSRFVGRTAELRALAERSRDGIPLARVTWEDILDAARRVGLGDEEIDALVA